MKKFFVIALIINALFTSCSKDDNGGGSDSGYMSFSAGNEWNYEKTNGGNVSSYSLTATENTEFKSGRQYNLFAISTGGNEYYAKSGSDYYSWADLGLPGATYENRYLIDNIPTNTPWDAGTVIVNIDTSLGGFSLAIDATIRFRKKIVENNGSLEVNAINYQNVIHTSTSPEVVSVSLSAGGFGISGTTLDLSSSNFQSYYARNYGLIADTSILGGTLTIPPILGVTTSATVVPLDNLINTTTRLMSANF